MSGFGASAATNNQDARSGSTRYCFKLELSEPLLVWPRWVDSTWLAEFLKGKPASEGPYLSSA